MVRVIGLFVKIIVAKTIILNGINRLLITGCLYGDGIHLTVAHKTEWSYGLKPDNKTVPLPCYLDSPYDHQRESSTVVNSAC